MKKKIFLGIGALIIVIGIILGVYYLNSYQYNYNLACNQYESKEYNKAVQTLSKLEDNVKLEFIEKNIDGDSNFSLRLLNTIDNSNFGEEKIKLYAKIIRNNDLTSENYEDIYQKAILIDKNYIYDGTKKIIYDYAKMKVLSYEKYDNDERKFQDVIDNMLMKISDYNGASSLIDRCIKDIADIYIEFGDNYSSRTLYADAINYYEEAIQKLQIVDLDTKKDIKKCQDGIKEAKKKSKDFEYCEAFGCARRKAPGELHYCSIHLKDPTATTPVATEKKENTSGYSYYHKCEHPGCTNYASASQYCSIHTTYNKCSYPGCNNRVSYSNAKYCSIHEIEKYNKK